MQKNIVCPQCKTLFGKETDGVLAIKNRDLYRQIEGKVWGPCRGCGFIVEWPQRPER